MKDRTKDQETYRRIDLALCLAIAGAVLVLMAPWLVSADLAIVSPTELGTDILAKHWPNAAYIAQARWEGGEIPLWRRAAMIGVPIVGNPSMLLVYPPYWLIFAFPIGWAFTAYFTLHLVWAGWGVYGLARKVLGLSPQAALLAALLFCLSAKVLAHMGGGHMDILAAIAWLSWFWWAVDELVRRPRWLPAAGAATAMAAQVLAHPPTAWLSALVAGCWALSALLANRAPGAMRRWLRFGLAGLGTMLLTLGLSAAQVWPMMELLPLATRQAMTLGEASIYALPIPLLVGLVLPTALAFPEWVVYLGFVTLALAPASWLARGRIRGWHFLTVLVILGIVLSLGSATPLYAWFYRLLPGMQWVRVPTRMIFLVQLSMACLAGMGWEMLQGEALPAKRKLVIWWAALLLLVAIGAAWTRWAPGMLAVSVGSVVMAMVAFVLLVGQFRFAAIRRYLFPGLTLLIVFESLILAPLFLARAQTSDWADSTPTVDFLPSQGERFRSYSPQGLISLQQAVVHGIETVDGNDPFQLDYYVRWANAASGCALEGYAISVPTCNAQVSDSETYSQAQPDATLLGMANVRYLVTEHALRQWPSPVWHDGSVQVYENSQALPLAFVAPTVLVEPDNAAALEWLQTHAPAEVAIVHDSPEDIPPTGGTYREGQVTRRTANLVEVQADGPGWLVLGEVWAPGWQADVDGTPARLLRTDVAFCGLALPGGSHKVTLRYAPTGWIWGRWISLGTVMGMLLPTAIGLGRRRRGRGRG